VGFSDTVGLFCSLLGMILLLRSFIRSKRAWEAGVGKCWISASAWACTPLLPCRP
jgi:hypothetical protein